MTMKSTNGKSLPINPDRREVLSQMYQLSMDIWGNEIFVGLSYDESVEYENLKVNMAYSDVRMKELREKHKAALADLQAYRMAIKGDLKT